MAEEDIAQCGADDFGEEAGCVGVIEMARIELNARFEILGIPTVAEHLQVVVAFNHKIVGLAHVVARAVGNGA